MVLVPTDAVGAVGIPVRDGLSRVPGADATIPATADATNAVVASCVVFVPTDAVGALGVPVRDGLASDAFKSNAACVAVETGLAASEVLSALPNPTWVFERPLTDP